jgi:hypothetical protein
MVMEITNGAACLRAVRVAGSGDYIASSIIVQPIAIEAIEHWLMRAAVAN